MPRVEHVLSWISRPPEWIARYTMIKHEKRKPLARKVRTKLLRTSWRRYRLDGLNTAGYGLLSVRNRKPGYTHILIDVGHPPNSIRQLQQEEESSNNQTPPEATTQHEINIPKRDIGMYYLLFFSELALLLFLLHLIISWAYIKK